MASCEPEGRFFRPKITKRMSERTEGVQTRDFVRANLGGARELHANYEMLGQLGRGGFGSVKLARHRSTGLLRAIKTVATGQHDLDESSAAEWERMIVEVEALLEMTHPNIVRLFEYYREKRADGCEVLYLVEEHCGGGTLEQRLRREKGYRLDAGAAAVVLRGMLRSVLCCHAHGMAHRDLKPDNFVFQSKEDAAAIKLIDFGLSHRPVAPTAEYINMAGTLEHSAPESFPARDEQGVFHRPRTKNASAGQLADLWSLGAIFFQILTGEPLLDLDRERSETAEFARMVKGIVGGVERDLIDDAASKIRSAAYLRQRLELARQRAPPAACDLLERMLAQDPAARITAAQALQHRFIVESYASVPRGHGVFDRALVPNIAVLIWSYSSFLIWAWRPPEHLHNRCPRCAASPMRRRCGGSRCWCRRT